jgi:quercetin dioxygenase-like cupin family protein
VWRTIVRPSSSESPAFDWTARTIASSRSRAPGCGAHPGADTTDGAYGLVESTIAPGASPPLHVHRREDEAFYVLEGEMTFRHDGEDHPAGPGTFVFLPRDVPHTFVVEGGTPARVLTLISPSGGEGFFVEGGRTPETEGLPPAGPPDIERMQRAAAVYESEIVGPPMLPRCRPPGHSPSSCSSPPG